MPKLTKRFIDTLEADKSGKDMFVWDSGDGAIKGFGIRIKPSGVSSYLVQYRNKEGRTRRLVFGKLSVMTPDDARKKAASLLMSVVDGRDPSAERHALRSETTVSQLCDLYLKDAALRIKNSTLIEDKIRIECHVKPLLGNRRVGAVTRADIEKFQTDIATGKTAQSKRKEGKGRQAKGGRGVAARTVGMLNTIMEFGRRRMLVNENPVKGVKKFEDNKKKRFLSIDEIALLGKTMREAETENPTGIAAIITLLLTGCRKTEILSLRRKAVDENARCFRFEDTKSGAQIRPVGAAALKHLTSIPSYSVRDEEDITWIFPSDRGDGHFVGAPKVLERLCAKAKLKDVTLHVFRHTFASVAAELGFSVLTIAALIGHSVPGVTSRYAHLPDRAILSAADAVSAYIASLINGESAAAEILPMRSATS